MITGLDSHFFGQFFEVNIASVFIKLPFSLHDVLNLIQLNGIVLVGVLARAWLQNLVSCQHFRSLLSASGTPASPLFHRLGHFESRIVVTWTQWLGKELKLSIVRLLLVLIGILVTSVIGRPLWRARHVIRITSTHR